MKPIYSLFIMLSFAGQLRAQNDTTELFPYGDMNQWMVRVVDESLVIGGNTKYLYEITPGDTLKNNTPYKNSISPWATSTVMAKVSGVVKASVTVFPEKRDSGYCPARNPYGTRQSAWIDQYIGISHRNDICR